MSVQAMEWARRQMVGDALAKSLLRAIADYADEHGHCWPSIGRLAGDCEVSEDTIRRKTKILEDADYLVRIRAFVDDSGRRNTAGKGRETSSEIRLRMDRMAAAAPSISVMEVTSEGEGSHTATLAHSYPRSLLPSQAATDGSHTATPGVALLLPLNEPSLNKKDSPQSPPEPEAKEAGQPREENLEGLTEFKSIYPVPSNRPSQVAALWSALGADERAKALTGARGVRVHRERDPKRPAPVVAPEKFLADPALWAEFARLAPVVVERPAPKPRVALLVGGEEWCAIAICSAIARRPPPRMSFNAAGEREIAFIGDPPSGAAAMAQLAEVDPTGVADFKRWVVWEKGSPQFAAWRTRVGEWLGFMPEAQRFWLDADGCIVAPDKAKRLPSGIPDSCEGLRVPPTETGFPPPKGVKAGADPPEQGGDEVEASEQF